MLIKKHKINKVMQLLGFFGSFIFWVDITITGSRRRSDIQTRRAPAKRSVGRAPLSGVVMRPELPAEPEFLGLPLAYQKKLTPEQAQRLRELKKIDPDEYSREIQKIVTSFSRDEQKREVVKFEQESFPQLPSLSQEPLRDEMALEKQEAMKQILSLMELSKKAEGEKSEEDVILTKKDYTELPKAELLNSMLAKRFDVILGSYKTGFYSKADNVFVYIAQSLRDDIEALQKNPKKEAFGGSSNFQEAAAFLENQTAELIRLYDEKQARSLMQKCDELVRLYQAFFASSKEYASLFIPLIFERERVRSTKVPTNLEHDLKIFLQKCDQLVIRYNEFVSIYYEQPVIIRKSLSLQPFSAEILSELAKQLKMLHAGEAHGGLIASFDQQTIEKMPRITQLLNDLGLALDELSPNLSNKEIDQWNDLLARSRFLSSLNDSSLKAEKNIAGFIHHVVDYIHRLINDAKDLEKDSVLDIWFARQMVVLYAIIKRDQNMKNSLPIELSQINNRILGALNVKIKELALDYTSRTNHEILPISYEQVMSAIEIANDQDLKAVPFVTQVNIVFQVLYDVLFANDEHKVIIDILKDKVTGYRSKQHYIWKNGIAKNILYAIEKEKDKAISKVDRTSYVVASLYMTLPFFDALSQSTSLFLSKSFQSAKSMIVSWINEKLEADFQDVSLSVSLAQIQSPLFFERSRLQISEQKSWQSFEDEIVKLHKAILSSRSYTVLNPFKDSANPVAIQDIGRLFSTKASTLSTFITTRFYTLDDFEALEFKKYVTLVMSFIKYILENFEKTDRQELARVNLAKEAAQLIVQLYGEFLLKLIDTKKF